MKSIVLLICLAVSLTTVFAGPAILHPEIQIKRDSFKVDPAELILLFESTILDIFKAFYDTSTTIVEIVLDRNAQQDVVADIITEAIETFEMLYIEAMDDFSAASPEELPSLVEGKLINLASLDAFTIAKVTIAVENESDHIRDEVATYFTNFLAYSVEKLQPLFDAINE